MYEHLRFETRDAVAVLTLNRPHVLNALNRALKAELADALDRVRGDPRLRALVLQGAGDAFSAGQDLREAKDLDGPGAEAWVREYERLYERLRALDIPVVAAVHGWCLGAGCQLALLADLRLADETARFGMPEIRDGIPAIFGLGLLWPLLGASRSLYLVLTGEALDARQALEAGLVARVVPVGTLEAEAEALARRLAAAAPVALRANKAWARELTEAHFRATARFCATAQREAFEAGDPRRAMEAFLARRQGP